MARKLEVLPEITVPTLSALMHMKQAGVDSRIQLGTLKDFLAESFTFKGSIVIGPDKADFITNGVADDVQIQAALDSAPSGARFIVQPSIYDIQATIIIDIAKGLYFEGSGFSTIFKAKNGLNDFVFTFVNTSLGIWARLANFKIEGNASNQTAGGGIDAPGSLECIFDGIWFHQCYDWGLRLYSISESPLDYGHNNKVLSCVFDEGDDSPGIGGGIYMEHNDENHISFNDFQFMGGAAARANEYGDGYAIYDKAGLNTITNNAVVNSYNGIQIRDAGNTIVANNVFDRMRFASLMVRGRQNVVRDNVFYQMGANTGLTNQAIGLIIDYYNSISVDGNWFISDGTNGVTRSFIKDNSDATGGGDSQFTNNYFFIDGTLGTGILEYGLSTKNLFRNNFGNTAAAKGRPVVTTTYTVSPLDNVVGCDSTSGAFTVTLPKASYSYQQVTIFLDIDAGDITIARGSGDKINQVAANQTLADAGDSITLESDCIDNWRIIHSRGI